VVLSHNKQKIDHEADQAAAAGLSCLSSMLLEVAAVSFGVEITAWPQPTR
jgi:hypothetical protein